jgi:hypothetical protein
MKKKEKKKKHLLFLRKPGDGFSKFRMFLLYIYGG